MIDIKSTALIRTALEVSEGSRSLESVPKFVEKEDQFELLLMVAHGQEGTIREVARHLLIENPDMMVFKEAAKSLVEHILFSHINEPYRLLGLTPLSTLAETKIRHQVLIRLFHPDRQTNNQEAAAHYSSLINEAFEKIKQNDKGLKKSKLPINEVMHSLHVADFDLRRQPVVLDRSRIMQKIFTPFNVIVLMLMTTVFILFVLYQVHKENLKIQAEQSYEQSTSKALETPINNTETSSGLNPTDPAELSLHK